MLWIEKYRPRTFDEIIGQEHVIAHLRAAPETRNVSHLLLSGPSGTGKSVAVECLARDLYGDRQQENTTVIMVSDLFEGGKRYLEGDERYAHVFRKDESLLTNFKNITRSFASTKPLDTDFRLLVFEGASSLPREAQHALRRTMERYSRTCRFIFITRRLSGIIPAISSRCLPFFFSPIPDDLMEPHLRSILAAEPGSTSCITEEDLDLIIRASKGDLRKAVMLLQIATGPDGRANLVSSFQTETGQLAHAALSAIACGDPKAAIRGLESLIIEYGLTSQEVLHEFRAAVRKDYHDPRIVSIMAETDYSLTHCNNEYIQLNAMVARIGKEVFS
jgi:replication factor C small subunit